MKVKLNNKDLELINSISDLLGIDYEIKKNEISIDNMLSIIENSKDTILHLNDELKKIDNEDLNEDFLDKYEDHRLGLL